jgi:hypothetical protein
VIFSIFTLFFQLFVLFACCLCVGLWLRPLLPQEFSPLNKALFSLIGGLFLVVLIVQNLFYLGVPVRISGWLLLGVALVQVWWSRHKLLPWFRTFRSNGETRMLAAVILLVIIFHGVAPVLQGLEWYYGKGHLDQINYVLLAEFLKEEPYGTSGNEIGVRPWLVGPVGTQDMTGQQGMSSGPVIEKIGLKKERIGQSIITAAISVWSGTDAKGGYATTVIFFLTLLAICLYVLLRETKVDLFLAGSGALLAALVPVLTRLSLNGFLSHVAILFIFPFFASLLRRQELRPTSFTLFFSLTIAYLISAYSEIAPIGFCTLFFGVTFLRRDKSSTKRLIVMSAFLLIILVNPIYLPNLVGFLGQQYYLAGNVATLGNMAPDLLTLRDWSELIFGAMTNAPVASFFDYCTLLTGLLSVAGYIILSRRDKLVFAAILLPALLVILYLATRRVPSYYPIAKITLTILPLAIGFMFVAMSRFAANNLNQSFGLLTKLLGAFILATAAAGSVRYYSEVFRNEGLLRSLREPRFLNVCRQLQGIRNQRVFVFETNPLLTPWLCYHARQNDVYYDGRLISDSAVPPGLAFSIVPDLANLDFIATRTRIVDLKKPSVPYLISIDDTSGEDPADELNRYWLGPPARLRFLALRPMSVNVKMRLAPGPEVTILPIEYFLDDAKGHVFQGEISTRKVEVFRTNLPRGLSYLELSAKAKQSDPNTRTSYPILAELGGIEISEIEMKPEK